MVFSAELPVTTEVQDRWDTERTWGRRATRSGILAWA